MRRLAAAWPDTTLGTEADRACAFKSLPELFDTRPDMISSPPPLAAIGAWAGRAVRLRGLRVGVAFDHPALLTALGKIAGVNFVALPGFKPVADPEVPVHDWSGEIIDLADAAGLITHLDLIITEGNVTAHLAASLGRPVWLLPPDPPRFPWSREQEDNAWYPTLRQFISSDTIAPALALMATDTPEDQTFAYGNACYRRKDYRAAATGYHQTLALKPDHPGALANLTVTMLVLGKPKEAVRYADLAVRAAPAAHPLRLRQGIALHAAGRFDEAVQRLRAARERNPGDPDTLAALGNALGASGRVDDAIQTLRQAIVVRPDHAQYHTSLAHLLLRSGHWTEGWTEHEFRPERPKLPSGAALWDGTPTGGTPLLLRHEQGIGDVIQFARYAPLAAARAGGPVYLTVPRTLRRLLQDLPGVSVLTIDDAAPTGALHFPLMSLPLLFGSIPDQVPYLFADSAPWRDRIESLPGLRAGIVWAGNPRLGLTSLGATDTRRSLPPGALAPLANVPDVSFVSLQVGATRASGLAMHDWTKELTDFAATAGLISALDLVISVDTATAHLAGALGKPVWLLNRFDTDWRWMSQGDHSIWYPTMRQFRQTVPGDWDNVLRRVAKALTDRPGVQPGSEPRRQ